MGTPKMAWNLSFHFSSGEHLSASRLRTCCLRLERHAVPPLLYTPGNLFYQRLVSSSHVSSVDSSLIQNISSHSHTGFDTAKRVYLHIRGSGRMGRVFFHYCKSDE